MSEEIKLCKNIFKAHSKTYYYSTLLFPRQIRHNVYVLYAFVRLADEIVDNPSEDPRSALKQFRSEFENCWSTGKSTNIVILTFTKLAHKFDFEKQWVDAFLDSMEMDLWKKTYDTYPEVETYIFGSAEVIGLMMSKLMGIKNEGLVYAQALGKSMQLINFIRDIKEDSVRERIYMPLEDLKKFGITEEEWWNGHFLDEKKILSLLQFEIQRTKDIQQTANKGFDYLPFSCRIAVRLAAFTYYDTLLEIEKNPLVVFQRKIKSSRRRMMCNFLHLLLHA
ncbi:MAG: phytoene/squalene synthase family protein [Candidatus Gracilibacteria bacterium]